MTTGMIAPPLPATSPQVADQVSDLIADRDEVTAAYVALYDRSRSAVANYVTNHTHNLPEGVRDEVTQNTWLKLWRYWPKIAQTYPPEHQFRYLLRVARSCIVDAQRRHQLEIIHRESVDRLVAARVEFPAPDLSSDPEQVALARELVDALLAICVTDREALALALALYEVPQRQIAAILRQRFPDQPEPTVSMVKALLMRLRERLRERLRAADLDPTAPAPSTVSFPRSFPRSSPSEHPRRSAPTTAEETSA